MEWLAAAIALLAAGATFWQASEARAARKDARAAAAEAKNDAATAANALTEISASNARTATALETIATPLPPWRIRRVSYEGMWDLINDSARNVLTKKVTGLTEADAEWFSAEGWIPNIEKMWEPGDSEIVLHSGAGSFSAPSSIALHVTWRWADDPDSQPDRSWKGMLA